MPNLAHWLGAEENRAGDALRRIQDRPTSILIARDEVDLPLQTVRLEEESTPSEVMGEGGNRSSRLRGTVFGVRNHPDPSVLDTDIQAGDQFATDRGIWRVIHVIEQTGEVQALCEVQA